MEKITVTRAEEVSAMIDAEIDALEGYKRTLDNYVFIKNNNVTVTSVDDEEVINICNNYPKR